MTTRRIPSPSDVKSAAQSAVEKAQAAASGAMRIAPASVQVAGQLPDLLENLAVAIERLNTTIERMERYMALADPVFGTLDRLLPQLEALVAVGDDASRVLSGIPGVGTLSRLASRASDERGQSTASAPRVTARAKAGEAKPTSGKPRSRSSRLR
jgi:hypothetical protein